MISNGLSVEEFPNPGDAHTVLVCPKLPSRFNNNGQPTWRKLFTNILKRGPEHPAFSEFILPDFPTSDGHEAHQLGLEVHKGTTNFTVI